MRKLYIFVLLALLLAACGKSSPTAVTTEPEQEVTRVISETTAPLETDSPDNGIPWNDPSSIGGSTWQEAYLSVIKCDRQQLLADPDNLRYPEDTYVYLGIHDFEGDGTPELIFGDGVSLAVFTYAEGRVERIADLYFPGNIWCVNGIAIHGNGMSVMCAGSGGMDCVNFGYIDGEYVLGLYAPRAHMEPTINGEVCTVDDINRIHTTDYNEMAPEEFREKIQLLFENGQWVLKLPSDEVLAADVTLDFSRFLWE